MSESRGDSGRHECDPICAQEHYDAAAWDYIDLLREMTAAQAAAHFRNVAWIETWHPETATRCPRCGDTVLELKWGADHTEWICLEPTCRNQWEWKKR